MPEDVQNVHELEQAKRRDRKVYITDIAIDKVPYIKYDGFTDERNKIMQELAKDVLLLFQRRKMTAMRLLLPVTLGLKIHLAALACHWGQNMR